MYYPWRVTLMCWLQGFLKGISLTCLLCLRIWLMLLLLTNELCEAMLEWPMPSLLTPSMHVTCMLPACYLHACYLHACYMHAGCQEIRHWSSIAPFHINRYKYMLKKVHMKNDLTWLLPYKRVTYSSFIGIFDWLWQSTYAMFNRIHGLGTVCQFE